MTFEYRELSTQVVFQVGEEDNSPCHGASHRDDDDGDDDDCENCSTTQEPQTNNCPGKPGDRDEWKALAELRQQLHEALSAG